MLNPAKSTLRVQSVDNQNATQISIMITAQGSASGKATLVEALVLGSAEWVPGTTRSLENFVLPVGLDTIRRELRTSSPAMDFSVWVTPSGGIINGASLQVTLFFDRVSGATCQ